MPKRQEREAGVRRKAVSFMRTKYVAVGRCISDLELIAKLGTSEDLANRVQFLPL